MSKVAHYLQEHLTGEVMTSTDARRYFATDGSILQMAPALVVYPRNENDVRKTARFSWQLAERGRVISLTSRGSGSNQSGAAIGNGIMLVFPAHMNRILEIDTKSSTVAVEPGINFGKLQQTLFTHGRFIPSYPVNLEYSSVGGSVATNRGGQASVKYGDMGNFVKALRIVLANGEVIETGRISKREVGKKLGLATFEGEIYRSLDALFEEQAELISKLSSELPRNNSGYNLTDVRQKDGSYDLTPLFIGSQGTLGIITEVLLSTESHNPQTSLFMAKFDSLEKAQDCVMDLLNMSDLPSAIELVDGNLLAEIYKLNPNQLKEVIEPPFPPIIMLVEFNDPERNQKRLIKKARKIFEKNAIEHKLAAEPEMQQMFWKVRESSGLLIGHNDGSRRALPLFDGSVQPIRLREYIDGLYKLMQANSLESAVWGSAGDGLVHMQPRLDLETVGDRQKTFRLLNDYAKLVLSLGGTLSAESGDGRLRAPYLQAAYGAELYAVLQKVKQIFDPYNTLNQGVKFGTSLDDVKTMIRPDFGIDHAYEHLPRS